MKPGKKIKLKKNIEFNMKIRVSFIEHELKAAEKKTERGTVASDGKQKIAQEQDSLPTKQGPYFQQLKNNPKNRHSLSIKLRSKNLYVFLIAIQYPCYDRFTNLNLDSQRSDSCPIKYIGNTLPSKYIVIVDINTYELLIFQL